MPGARSEIGTPIPDFSQQYIQNCRPKTNLSHFQKLKEKKRRKVLSLFSYINKALYTYFINYIHFSMISDINVPNGWYIVFI